MRRRTIRSLAVAAVAAQPLFIAAWIVAGALQPGYSHVHSGVSDLGAETAAHPWIVNSAITMLGLSFVALAVGLYAVLPQGRRALVAALVVGAAGLALALSGPANLDCQLAQHDCRHLIDEGTVSWQTYAHLWLGLISEVLLLLTPIAVARALSPGPAGAALVTAGLIGVTIGVLTFAGQSGADGIHGLAQRIGLLVLHSWAIILAGGILYATRTAAKPGPLVPLRPRDFMAGEWTGEGEMIARPFFLGRRFPQRLDARRRTISISDTLWRVDDEAHFGGSGVMHRQTYVEWVTDDHLRLTANDLPDGADMWLEEGGYRMTPFRMTFPIGPLPVLIRVEDTSYMAEDGTFVNQFDARDAVFGIPLARTLFRVRPSRAEYSRASASAPGPASSEASRAP